MEMRKLLKNLKRGSFCGYDVRNRLAGIWATTRSGVAAFAVYSGASVVLINSVRAEACSPNVMGTFALMLTAPWNTRLTPISLAARSFGKALLWPEEQFQVRGRSVSARPRLTPVFQGQAPQRRGAVSPRLCSEGASPSATARPAPPAPGTGFSRRPDTLPTRAGGRGAARVAAGAPPEPVRCRRLPDRARLAAPPRRCHGGEARRGEAEPAADPSPAAQASAAGRRRGGRPPSASARRRAAGPVLGAGAAAAAGRWMCRARPSPLGILFWPRHGERRRPERVARSPRRRNNDRGRGEGGGAG